MTTEPNGIVEPIHEKAMPVMLMAPNDVEPWLRGHSVDDALKNAEARTGRSDCDPADEKKAA
jgi:putative SOS response-associated peptidase YedK